MPVPDTNTFTLQDVVDVVSPSSDTLQACFDNAVDDFFDPAYEGSKDSLLNFRNYGGSVEMWIGYDTGAGVCGYVDHNNAAWATVRGAATGSNVDTTSNWEVYVDYTGGIYYINRTFLRFDLSAIPVSAICEAAGIGFDIVTSYGSVIWCVGLEGTQGASLGTDDFDAFTFSDYLFSSFQDPAPDEFDPFNYAVLASTSGQLQKVEDAFGGYLYVAIINGYYDNGNNAPSSKNGFQMFRAGEVYSAPELRVVFTI